MAKRNQVINELKRLGVKEFNSQNIANITYSDGQNGIDVDFWNIGRVFTNKYGHSDCIGLSVRFLTKKNDKINCHDLTGCMWDIKEISLDDLKACKTWIDLKNLVQSSWAHGLKVA